MVLPRLTALGHPRRIAVFRLLMRRFPDRVPAGEIEQVLNVKASTMSVRLCALRQVGLILQQPSGASLSYKAETEAARSLVSYLFPD